MNSDRSPPGDSEQRSSYKDTVSVNTEGRETMHNGFAAYAVRPKSGGWTGGGVARNIGGR